MKGNLVKTIVDIPVTPGLPILPNREYNRGEGFDFIARYFLNQEVEVILLRRKIANISPLTQYQNCFTSLKKYRL